MTWNPGAERIKQYTADEIVGMNFGHFFTPEDIEKGRPAEILRLASQRGRFEEEGWRVRKDGSRFWAHASLTAIHDSTGALTGFAKVTRDMTESKQAQETLITELSGLLLANVDISKMLGAFSASIGKMVPHDMATLGLFEEATGKLRVQFLSAVEEGLPSPREVLLDPDASPAGRAFRTRQPLILNRIDRWPFAPESVHHMTSLGMQSGLWVPLIHRERVLGALAVASRKENAFVQRDAEVPWAARRPGGDGRKQCTGIQADRRAARPAEPGESSISSRKSISKIATKILLATAKDCAESSKRLKRSRRPMQPC